MSDSPSGRLARDKWVRRLYLPAYAVGEVAHLARLHRTTIGNWYYGRPRRSGGRGHKVLGERERGASLSYLDLVEVAFVATLRNMGVRLRRIRIARDYLARVFNTDYPFARLKLKTDGARILYDLKEEEGPWVDRLLGEASAYGQVIWKEPILDRIMEFDYDLDRQLAIRWFPRGREAPVVVDPQIQFGAPILRETGVPTWVVKERYEVGETVDEIKADFGIELQAIMYALAFEGIQPVVATA